jgi:uncharacterized protein (TIGR03435 family)
VLKLVVQEVAMKRLLSLAAVLGMIGATGVCRAQGTSRAAEATHVAGDISGNWQGTLHTGKDLRIILTFYKGEKDGWSAKMYSIDQGAQPINATSVVKQGDDIKIAVDAIGGVFDGKLSADGKTISGKWTQGPTPLDLVLVKATPETAWEIPAPPPPPKVLPADADPSFAVATIKPNPSGAPSMQGLNTNGHDFRVRNGSLGDLVSFAYNVQMKQIIGGPSWMDVDRYDIDAKQDQDGLGTDKQLRSMVRKLIEDRFQIKIHHEKRDFAAFVLTVGKGGQKLTASQSKGPLPGMGFIPRAGGIVMRINNGTLDDMTDFLQSAVLDRPVVNHTGIAGRYDISMKFTPDDSQFKGHPPKIPADTDTVEAAPSLFEAIEQQLGLKLSSEKTAVDAIVIDHVEKPSAN